MIPFLSLKKINDRFNQELIEACTRVINSGWYISGKEVESFEANFAKFCGVKHAIGVANGLDALTLTLRAWKELGLISEGDEVLVPANTYIASVLAITENKLKPVFVEPCPETFNILAKDLNKYLTKKTKVVLAVHLYGQICQMESINAFAKENGLLVLEDSAQAHGASINNIRAGAWGDASGFSFYPGKNLGALGDAGMVTTSDSDLNNVIRALANYGSSVKYVNNYKGVNSRLDEMQAAMLDIKLKYLDKDIEVRRDIAKQYSNNISNKDIITPVIYSEENHVWHLYVLKTNSREKLIEHLKKKDVSTLIHYPIPPHKQNAYKEYAHLSLPITEKIHEQVLSLPIDPTMSTESVQKVIEAVNEFTA